VNPDQLDVPPQVISVPEVVFPPSALNRTIRNKVVQVKVVITAAGDVVTPEIVDGDPLLREAALEIAVRYKFRPGSVRGFLVATFAIIQIKFDSK
jgi:hypothetical protein